MSIYRTLVSEYFYLILRGKQVMQESTISTVKYSDIINDRGVFANKIYNIGDIIEICPTITVPFKISKPLQSYVFEYDNDYNLFPLGYCGMYNHSDTPNTEVIITNNKQIKFVAIKKINIDDEIYFSYGQKYWNEIGILKK